ncbi:MAG: HAMP domain-containing sensor histidine kinase, partial [Patescibacteria group bacterium]
ASHQLNAPLSSIRWNIEMLLNEDIGHIDQEQRAVLTDVLDSNSRMMRLVNDLLNVSRLEEGRINIEPKPINIKTLVEDILNEYKHFIGSRGVKVRVVCDKSDADHVLNVDPVIIRQVINNLIVNAVQYANSASAEIIITLEPGSVDYQLSVWDNGIGIPKNVQKKIFTKFFRADNAQSKEAIGTGLGLYITKMMVELSGGKIWFKSDPKSGTTFFLTIPLRGSTKSRVGKQLIN